MAYIDDVNNILQIQPNGMPAVVRLSQNENGRNLYFTLSGNESAIPSTVTVTISGTKPDGNVYSGTGSITNNVILIEETVQMTAVAGTWDAKIQIISGGNTIATGRIRFVIDADTVEPGSVPSESELNGLVAQAQQYAEDARSAAYGSPLTASTASAMIDKTRVYVYTGSESGYTNGHWYYWNGTAWTDGGAYNSTGVQTDTTLSVSGAPADAKATGDAITAEATARAAADTAINGEITQLKQDLTAEETARESADDAINAELATKADADGTIASAEQLLSEKYTTDQVPYTFRASGGDGADREYDEIVGGSIAWNQLCNGTSVTVTSGHKYLLKKSDAWGIGSSTGSAITGLTSGSDMVCDLTQMFGSTIADYIYSLEQATAGAGVAWFKKLFPKDYYAYDAGTMMHVSGLSSHDMVGFNAWDEEWDLGDIDGVTGEFKNGNYLRSKNLIPVLPNTIYYFNLPGSIVMYEYDADGNAIVNNGSYAYHYIHPSNTYTTSAETQYLAFRNDVNNASQTYNHDICINLSWDGERNGEYEPYIKHSYPLDDSLTLRGIPKLDSNNQMYYDGDTYAADGTVTRKYGVRAYQSGDASDGSTMVTDGTNTVYKLTTPTTETAESFTNPQICDPYGTEEYVTTSLVPVGHNTKYPANLRSAIERVMEQVPEAPSANGTYTLKATRTSSGVTYAWTAD